MNQLIVSNCLEVLKKMEAVSVDLMCLDPPLCSNRNDQMIWGAAGEVRSFQDRGAGGIAGLKEQGQELQRALKPTEPIIEFYAWDFTDNAMLGFKPTILRDKDGLENLEPLTLKVNDAAPTSNNDVLDSHI